MINWMGGRVVILKRKVLTAILSSLLFALVFSFPIFDLNGLLNLYYINLMFVITYGVLASLFSDWLSKRLLTETYAREGLSFVLHCFFGSVFLTFSFVSAIIFFIMDRLLKKIEIKWWMVILAFLLIVIIFMINVL
jgi:hypothetical protein